MKPPEPTHSLVSLSPKVEDLLRERAADGLPIWVRPPKDDAEHGEHFTGLSRAMLYKLARLGKIKSASLRLPGAIRGARLFHLKSILELIESRIIEKCEAEQSEERGDAASTESIPGAIPVSSVAAWRSKAAELRRLAELLQDEVTRARCQTEAAILEQCATELEGVMPS